jgi:hypothetical protein
MRKTFLLGGNSYTAPDPIGAGIRARISQITADIADEKKIPNNNEIIQRYFYDYSLRLLEIVLIPSEGSPSIKESYDSATDEEVQAVMDFFSGSVSGKTKSAPSRTKGSGSSKRTPVLNT